MGEKSGRPGVRKKNHIGDRCSKGCGQNIDGGCGVRPESSEDSIHSTSLTQIQTSQEADEVRKIMEEVEGEGSEARQV